MVGGFDVLSSVTGPKTITVGAGFGYPCDVTVNPGPATVELIVDGFELDTYT